MNAWAQWRRFLVRPRFPPDGRGIRSAILGDEDCKGVSTLQDITRRGGRIVAGSRGREEREFETRSDTLRNVQVCDGRMSGNGETLRSGDAQPVEGFLASWSASYV